MNERIKELVAQSYDEVPHEREWDAVSQVFNREKFAELIINECSKIAIDCYTYHEPLSKVPDHILKFERLTDENMNRDLISRLYKESVDYCVEQGLNEDGTNKAWVWEEKFVELIVQECIREIDSNNIIDYETDDWYSGYDAGISQSIKTINEHFGIKS